MTTHRRTRKPTPMQKSADSLTRLTGSRMKMPVSTPDLESVNQPLPSLDNTNMNPNPSQPPNPSLSQSQSPLKVTGTTDVSAAAKRKLTADEVKFAKLNQDLKETVGSIGAMLLVVGTARKSDAIRADGMVVLQHNEKLCNDLTALAEKYEYVYNGLNSLVQATVWGAVISDVAAIALGIAANHGLAIPGIGESQEQVPAQAAA